MEDELLPRKRLLGPLDQEYLSPLHDFTVGYGSTLSGKWLSIIQIELLWPYLFIGAISK